MDQSNGDQIIEIDGHTTQGQQHLLKELLQLVGTFLLDRIIPIEQMENALTQITLPKILKDPGTTLPFEQLNLLLQERTIVTTIKTTMTNLKLVIHLMMRLRPFEGKYSFLKGDIYGVSETKFYTLDILTKSLKYGVNFLKTCTKLIQFMKINDGKLFSLLVSQIILIFAL